MWKYEVSTGRWLSPEGDLVGVGYAGGNHGQNPEGRNNLSLVSMEDIGPIPPGRYRIGKPYTHSRLGPLTMNLYPAKENEMYGRRDFRIHADSIKKPGEGSDGCPTASHDVREMIGRSLDRYLDVVPGLVPEQQTLKT